MYKRQYLDWVLMALTRPGCRIAVREIPLEELLGREMEHQAGKTITKELLLHMNTEQTFAPEYREQLEYILSYRYPHEADQSLYAKMSVSEIKRAEQNVDEEESRRLLEPEPAPVPLVPSFMEKKEQSLTAASRGTAYHRVMERLPFGRLKTDADIGSYIEEMAESGYLDPEIAKTIPARVIRRFLDSGVGRRMERAFLAGTLHRLFQLGVPGIPVAGILKNFDVPLTFVYIGHASRSFRDSSPSPLYLFFRDALSQRGLQAFKNR